MRKPRDSEVEQLSKGEAAVIARAGKEKRIHGWYILGRLYLWEGLISGYYLRVLL